MTQIQKLKSALETNGSLTAKQIATKLKIKNPHEAVRKLRESGVCVYGNTATLKNGTKTTKYRIGTPSKAMIAAAYALAGGDMFTA